MENLEYLDGTIIEEFNDELADTTVNNSDLDWSVKQDDGIGEVD